MDFSSTMFLSVVFIFTVLWYIFRIYLPKRPMVQYANRLPSMKLRFYHFLGHVSLLLSQRTSWKKGLNDYKPHVYDFISLNGFNVVFSKKGIVNIWQIYYPFVCITQADAVEVILNHSTELKKAWFYELLYPFIGQGLLTSYDERWRKKRKMLTPAFHFNILKDFLLVFNKQSRILVDILQSHTKEEFIDIVPPITKCSLDIICEAVLGKEVHSQTQPSSSYVKAVVYLTDSFYERMQSPWYWNDFMFKISPFGRKFMKNVDIVHSFTRQVISEKKAELEKRSGESLVDSDNEVEGSKRRKLALMDLLLEEHFKRNSISEEEIREEVDTFTFEGHDTTASGISWCLWMIGLHPWIQDKIHEELDSIFENDSRDATMEDLKGMKHLECVIKESLRLYPPVPAFGRMLRNNLQIDEYVLPEGSVCLIMPYLLHRDPVFFPNPEKFDPDRFSPENIAGRHPFAYVPFSAGPRNCIGQRFALMEEKTVLSSVLRKFKVRSLDPRDKVQLLDEVVLRPYNGLRVQIRERSQPFDFHAVYYFP